MLIAFALISIIALVVMALAPEYFIVGIIVLFGLAIWFGLVKLGRTEGQKMITGRVEVAGIVILLVSVVLATVILAGWIQFDIGAPTDYQTTTKERIVGEWQGKGMYTDQGDIHEFLHHSFYVSAWTGSDDSEEIHIQGKICEAEAILWNFDPDTDDVRYRIWMTTGTDWGDEPVYNEKVDMIGKSGDCALYPTRIFTIQGSFDGWLKAEIRADFGNAIAGPTGWHTMAYDCARIESGKGDINFVEGIYEVGEDAKLELDLGYAKGQYHLQVKALTTGEMLFEGFIDEEDEGKITYMEFRVKASHVGIGTWPDCPDNLIEAKLWNELFEKAQHETAVTDIKTLGPQKPTISLSSPADGKAYRTGETITITIKADPNLQTQAPIKEYRLHISPGDIVEENTGGTFTFQPAHRGTFKLMYSCQDAVCRRSEVVTKEIHVYDIGEDPPIIEGDFPWSIILILIAGLIAFLITVVVAKDKGASTIKSVLFGAVAFIIVLLIALYFTGEIVI